MDDLSIPDRATLAAWKTVNVGGWTLLAAFLALNLHTLVAIAGPWHMVFARPGAETPALTVAQFAIRAAIAGAVGIGIGVLVGRKVWRRQAFWAGVAAAGYVLIVAIAYEQNSSVEGYTIFADDSEVHWRRATSVPLVVLWELVAAATVPLAAWSAARTAKRRRPVAEPSTL